jgi:hypothetical protein
MSQPIVQPALALMFLTMVVWIYMYIMRIGYIRQHGINPDTINSPEQLNAALPDRVNAPSNNLKNLFELPVIFYTICGWLVAIGNTDGLFVRLAWSYVALRVLHSLIHCTINRVIWRFSVYLLSSLVLWFMVIRFALLSTLPSFQTTS